MSGIITTVDRAESQLHLRVLRDSLIDCDIAVDDARRELDAALDRVREAVARRDDVARQLERAIEDASR